MSAGGGGEGLVVVYHRVARPGVDPFGLRVAPERFAAQLALIRRVASPLPLPELAARARAGTLPRRAIAVTIDDGSPDTLEHAAPLLREQAMPATVFVATSPRVNRDYWWEELASLLLRPGRLPHRLELRVGGRRYVWELGPDAYGSPAAAARHAAWRAFSGPPPTSRHALFEALWRLFRPLPSAARHSALTRLRDWAGARERRASPRARPLTGPEIRRLAETPGVEIGAHTSTHPLLSALPPEHQRKEIEGSRDRLEHSLRRPVRSFAYPYGAPGCFTSETVALVKASGFALACSTRPARVRRWTNPRSLPRLAVGDWPEADFARWLEAWLG